MKKILTLLLALALVFALACPVFADEEVENFLKADAKWEKGTARGGVTIADGVATATGIEAEFTCPSINLLPSIKDALGSDDEVEITISFEVRANFVAGSTDSSTCRVLFRGTNGISGLGGADNADAWLEAYEDSLDGDEALFTNSKGNILKYFNRGATSEITDEWTRYTSDTLFLTEGQINNPSVIEWKLTLDKIVEYANIESLEFRNVIVAAGEIEVDDDDEVTDDPETDAPATDDKPATDAPAADDKPAAEEKPEATQKPAVATPAITEAPANNGPVSFNATAVLITSIISATVIIVACIVAIIVVKKKTTK